MGGGLESRCVGGVYGEEGAVRVARHHPHRTHHLRSGSQDHLYLLHGAESFLRS